MRSVREGLGGGESDLQSEVLGGAEALFLGPLTDLEEKRSHPHETRDTEGPEDLDLDFPVAHTGGEEGAAERPEGVIEHHARRGHLVAEGVDADIAPPEAGGEERFLPTPALVEALGVVDGTRGPEHAADLVEGDREQTAEGRVRLLELHELGLGCHGHLGEVLEGLDVARLHPGLPEEGADGGCVRRGVRDDVLEPQGLLVPLLVPAALLQVLVQESCGPVHGLPLSGI